MSRFRPTTGQRIAPRSEPTTKPGGSLGAVVAESAPRVTPVRMAQRWLAGSRLGLVVMALVVGAGAGLGAVVFRELIFGFTWLVTGYQQFGQQGHAPSLHLAWLGIFFVLVVPVIGGLIYGPMIYRFAREARGHGVPEVMLAVAENGGRIRPPVTIVKALASAVCIGVGGSVGREGPIVQIGSALASSLGQLVRMSESRLRIIVACGAAGGISATFNAPITGLFFGFEIVLREFSLDALFATSLAAVTGDVISRAFFGSAPFFTGIPKGLVVSNDLTYLLVGLLGVIAGLIGVGFKTVLYKLEDRADELWEGRPEWARPAVGGIVLGVILLVLPQMYGVGYPVMNKVFAGDYVLWFIVILMFGKIVAASVTLSIGGSGGVFAPSLFMGAAAGTAFGLIAQHLFGPAIGPPALYGVVAMGGVFAGAAQAPLTAIASVVEMSGNYGLTVSIMLATGIAAALGRRITYGSIYTTKLLRRGIDIERPRTSDTLQSLTVGEVMQPLSRINGGMPLDVSGDRPGVSDQGWQGLVGPVAEARQPQALFADEDLERALRQLVLFGRDGLPVLSHDGQQLQGWISRADVLHAIAERMSSSSREIERGAVAADFAAEDPVATAHTPDTPLIGYRIVELSIDSHSPARDKRIDEISWPPGCHVVAVTQGRRVLAASPDLRLRVGERVIVLEPAPADGDGKRQPEVDRTPVPPDAEHSG